LIFEDYAKRELSILEKNYLKLMTMPDKQEHRSCLEECLTDPTEVWWEVRKMDDIDVTFYKYIKLYSNGTFMALALVDEVANLFLNNFYWFDISESEKVEKLRRGILISSNLNN
jgi:hypothetical protein